MADGDVAPSVRVRGIYATALTQWLQQADGFQIVDPSPPIADRFEAEFDADDPTVDIAMTDDRLSLLLTGKMSDTKAVTDRIRSVGIDTFGWADPTPDGAIFEGRVKQKDGRGWIVDLDGSNGYLPGRRSEIDLSPGETIIVQVRKPSPPWTDKNPTLDTSIRAPGGLATLRRGVEAAVADTPAGEVGQELARTTQLLSVSIPEAWGVAWTEGAIDADMGTLETALSRVVDRAERIEEELDTGAAAESGRIARPLATRWVRFGRESRFALDEKRGVVTETMAGHHRIKAGSEHAGTAVDFVEALAVTVPGFPFGAVTDAFGPVSGDTVRIVHTKPSGEEFDLGRGTVTDRTPSNERVTVKREMSSSGRYDAIGTARERGDTATTRFAEGRWWYPTVYRGENGESKGTYVNIATPVEVFPNAIRYVDLYVDVVKRPDGSVEVVDEDELAAARDAGHVPESVAEKATETASKVADVLAE